MTSLRTEPRGCRRRRPHPLATDRLAAARLSRGVPELRRAGRVPLGGVGRSRSAASAAHGRPRRRRAAQDRRERRAVRRPHAAAARRGRHATRAPRFTLVGRLQYRYADGTWNEWHALFDSGDGAQKSGWLSEDNGRYVVAFDAPLDDAACRRPTQLQPGAPLTRRRPELDASPRSSPRRLIAAAGRAAEAAEPRARLRRRRPAHRAAARSARSTTPTRRGRAGRSAARSRSSELAMTGLREAQREDARRPQRCSARAAARALQVKLATTQSIVCAPVQGGGRPTSQQGTSAATSRTTRRATAASRRSRSAALGTLALGSAEPLPWQVVGYVERCEVRRSSDDDEQTLLARVPALPPQRGLRLPRRRRGRLELDARRSPARRSAFGDERQARRRALPEALRLRRQGHLRARRVLLAARRATSARANTDYAGTGAASAKRLNRERDRRARARARSSGRRARRCSADAVLKRVPPRARQARGAAARRAADGLRAASLLAKVFFWVFIVVVVLMLFRCGSGGGRGRLQRDAQHLRRGVAGVPELPEQPAAAAAAVARGGGSFGGFSSGGGHK